MSLFGGYAQVAGTDVIAHLRQLAAPLASAKVVHVNSTRTGGGVAEILTKLIPLTRELGIDTDCLPLGSPTWEDTGLAAPEGTDAAHYRNILTEEPARASARKNRAVFSAADLFKQFPVALLVKN